MATGGGTLLMSGDIERGVREGFRINTEIAEDTESTEFGGVKKMFEGIRLSGRVW